MDRPDLLLSGGPIWTGERMVDAIGVADGIVTAAGSIDEVATTLRPGFTRIDTQGRRAIPGLIDSHIHVLRAGLTWNHVTSWDDVDSLEHGLAAIRLAAEKQPDDSWLRVLGGWHPGTFPERRGPTRAELDEASDGHPAYVQLLYEEGMLNSRGLELLLDAGDVPGVERDDEGAPTGRVAGPIAFGRVAALFEQPSAADREASTRAVMADFNAKGLTGTIDPGGFGIDQRSYDTMFDMWRSDTMTVRVRLYLVPQTRGNEVAEVRDWVKFIQPRFGDDMLRYVGMGEILTFGCHDMEGVRPFEVSDQARAELLEISDLLAVHDWPIHMHAIFDSTISAVLDTWEEIDRRHGLAGRRWSLGHAEPISRQSLERVKALDMGIAVQNRMMFRSADSTALWGETVGRNSPPLGDILDMGIPLGAGTDATVVSPFDPWRSIWWLVTGKSVDGAPPRSERHRLSIEQALTAYTRGSAWFSFDEHNRGHLEAGALADVAVLNRDPFAIDPDELPSVSSDLTLVGGRTVHAAGEFA
ncbi:MAG TPA: amidohydrolase [Acidimicrobiia bacterium]